METFCIAWQRDLFLGAYRFTYLKGRQSPDIARVDLVTIGNKK